MTELKRLHDIEVATSDLLPLHSLGAVQDDWHAAELWLQRLSMRTPPVSDATLRSYRTEIQRLRWYCERFNTAAPSRWNFQDAMAYLQFMIEKAGQYVSARGLPPTDEAWTPFKAPPSSSTVANTKKVMNSLYAFWREAGYVLRNPFAGTIKATAGSEDIVRSLPDEFLDAVYRSIEQRPKLTQIDFLTAIRNRFIVRLLERTGLRASEALAGNMNDVQPITDPKTGQVYWGFHIRHGKGGSTGTVFLDAHVMADFMAYRRAFGFEDTPTDKDTTALILSTRTYDSTRPDGEPVGYSSRAKRRMRMWRPIRRRQALWEITKAEFNHAAALLRQNGYAHEANVLEGASTHWLRHTFGTRLVRQGQDIRFVAQAMRHRNIRRTMIYTNLEFLDVARVMSSMKSNL